MPALSWYVPGLGTAISYPQAMRQLHTGTSRAQACKALYSTSFYASLCGSGHVIFFSASLLPLFWSSYECNPHTIRGVRKQRALENCWNLSLKIFNVGHFYNYMKHLTSFLYFTFQLVIKYVITTSSNSNHSFLKSALDILYLVSKLLLKICAENPTNESSFSSW